MNPLTETGYGIVISAGKPGEFFAMTNDGRFFSPSKQRALQFAKYLEERNLRGKVVKMKVTYEVL